MSAAITAVLSRIVATVCDLFRPGMADDTCEDQPEDLAREALWAQERADEDNLDRWELGDVS